MNKKGGFTLVEVLIASIILVGTLAVILGVFTQCLNSAQSSSNHIKAINMAQHYLEKIRVRIDPANDAATISFSNLGRWNNQTFQLENGKYVVVCYVSQVPNAPMTIWDVKVLTCWREAANRILGEDDGAGDPGNALNGQLDLDEDENENGELDSPAQLQTILVEGGT